LDHAEIVVDMMFPTDDDSAEVVEPGKEALDLPAAPRTAERAAILGARSPASMGGDHLDAVACLEQMVEWVAVVAAIAN
jgi:hypothetical protein